MYLAGTSNRTSVAPVTHPWLCHLELVQGVLCPISCCVSQIFVKNKMSKQDVHDRNSLLENKTKQNFNNVFKRVIVLKCERDALLQCLTEELHILVSVRQVDVTMIATISHSHSLECLPDCALDRDPNVQGLKMTNLFITPVTSVYFFFKVSVSLVVLWH